MSARENYFPIGYATRFFKEVFFSTVYGTRSLVLIVFFSTVMVGIILLFGPDLGYSALIF